QGRDGDGRAARHLLLRLSRQPAKTRAQGLSHRRRVELGECLQNVRREGAEGRAAAEFRARWPRRRLRENVGLRSGGAGGGEHADAVKAEIMKGGYAVFKGPLKDNKGKAVVPAGKAFQETAIELESMDYLVDGVVGSTS